MRAGYARGSKSPLPRWERARVRVTGRMGRREAARNRRQLPSRPPHSNAKFEIIGEAPADRHYGESRRFSGRKVHPQVRATGGAIGSERQHEMATTTMSPREHR